MRKSLSSPLLQNRACQFPGTRLLARLVYRLLKYGEAYVAQGMAEYEQTYRERVVQSLARKAKAPGYKLLPTTDDTLQASSA